MKNNTIKEIINIVTEEPLPYFNEYLILSDGITIQEAKELLTELDFKMKEKLQKIKKYFFDQLDILKKKEAEALEKSNDPYKNDMIKKHYRTLKRNLKAAYLTAIRTLNYGYEKSLKSIKSALLKKNPETLKGLAKLKTGTKIGAVAAVIGGAGYAAYQSGK
jgi:hypothetical protein